MRWTIYTAHIVIILTAGIVVLYDKGDWSTGCPSFKDARKKLNLILLVARSGYGTLSGTATCHLASYKILIYDNTCRKTVKHATYGCAMRFPECRKTQKPTYAIHFSII
jgi:hypothetical protein